MLAIPGVLLNLVESRSSASIASEGTRTAFTASVSAGTRQILFRVIDTTE